MESYATSQGATLIGNGPDAMSKISLIGNDMSLDDGIGTCGKEGQSSCGVGQPTLLMGGITVGGLIPIKMLESIFNKYFINIFSISIKFF